jgi:selenide,water dikinase
VKRVRLLLAGGGHAHVEVLRSFARSPLAGAELVVVAPSPTLLYSGMVPGVIAGHYAAADATIDVAALARAAGARLVVAAITTLDVERRTATTSDGVAITFDVASLDVGAITDTALPGAVARAIPVRPLAGLVAACERLFDDAAHAAVRHVAVVGGGAAGIEIACAMGHRLRASPVAAAVAIALVTDQREIAASHPRAVHRRLARALARRDISVVAGRAARAIDAAGIALDGGARIDADRIVLATPAVAAPWLARSGLACDAAGFVQIDANLRSVSHPAVFAAGDCATRIDAQHPRSGVYAVRAGPPLALNLRRVVDGGALVAYRTQRTALTLISLGDRDAVASRPPWSAQGSLLWRWKDRIDRRFVARYRDPA